MRRWLIRGAILCCLLVATIAIWGHHRANARLTRTYATHTVSIPVPYPSPETATTQTTSATTPAEQLQRAIARGRHLVMARYGCADCHGEDLGGGTMIDDPAIGNIFGPNLTSGEGGVTQNMTMADWDRIIRHGVRRDGTAAIMPSQDFADMSDQELSDIVAFIRSLPPVDRTMPARSFGPIGLVLVATGKFQLAAEHLAGIEDHIALPPDSGETIAFGKHLAATCRGCHGSALSGGPIIGGAPDWPPAANLTPHEQGLADWNYKQFAALMRTGNRPDGTRVRTPMDNVIATTRNMSETELRALWLYLQSLKPLATDQAIAGNP
ncbi:MAG: cytochrome C [Candidatus Dadabacteria bacterium]|nr:MAG: cytochrome C [Candidatus Dadabacteria bacterium]